MERFIEPRASKTFGHPVDFLNVTGSLIVIPGPYEEFFNVSFGLWIDSKKSRWTMKTNQDSQSM